MRSTECHSSCHLLPVPHTSSWVLTASKIITKRLNRLSSNLGPYRGTDRRWSHYYVPPLIGGDIKRYFCLTLTSVWRVWCLTSVCRVHQGQKVKVTRPLCSPPYWRVRRLQRWTWERVGRGKLLQRCCLLGGARRFGANGGGEGLDLPWRPPAYSLLNFARNWHTDNGRDEWKFESMQISRLFMLC